MKRYLEATHWAADQIEEVVTEGRLDFPEYTFADAVVCWSTGIGIAQNTTSGPLPSYYVSDSMAAALDQIARHEYQFFDVSIAICTTNILAGVPVPGALKIFIADVLMGKLKRPTPAHRQRDRNWLAHSYIYNLTHSVVDKFGLTLTRNEDGKHKDSACDVISGALEVCGVPTKYSYIRDLMTSPDKKQLRAEFDAAARIWWRTELVKAEPPRNALNPDTHRLEQQLVEMTVRDILVTFSRSGQKGLSLHRMTESK